MKKIILILCLFLVNIGLTIANDLPKESQNNNQIVSESNYDFVRKVKVYVVEAFGNTYYYEMHIVKQGNEYYLASPSTRGYNSVMYIKNNPEYKKTSEPQGYYRSYAEKRGYKFYFN